MVSEADSLVDTYDEDHLVEAPTDTQLQRIAKLALLQVSQEREVVACEAALKVAQDALKQTAERDLPNLMNDVGISEFKLTNGGKVSIKTKVVGAINAENRQAAFEWLHRHGFGPIVKRDVEVQFGRGDAMKATKLLGYLKRWYKDYKVSDKEAVHGGTLNAWAREIVERNKLALVEGGRVLKLPDEIRVTELRATVVVLPENATR